MRLSWHHRVAGMAARQCGRISATMGSLNRKKARKKATAMRNGDSISHMDIDRARMIAIEFCLFHYPTLYTAGVPRLATTRQTKAWSVPVVLEDPDAGISQQVGEVLIHRQTGKLMNHTPTSQVVAQGKKLYQGQRDVPASAAVSPCRQTNVRCCQRSAHRQTKARIQKEI